MVCNTFQLLDIVTGIFEISTGFHGILKGVPAGPRRLEDKGGWYRMLWGFLDLC